MRHRKRQLEDQHISTLLDLSACYFGLTQCQSCNQETIDRAVSDGDTDRLEDNESIAHP
jgi:hypothetical protein